ncbi:3-ketodihydrosphingosine reductase TSC10, related [Neospora caninum Liverpool]|uniref:3-ketodihydrosphingosine reductase TSC10, related n=1 Tax=Neospora caninum (strain Liverpool) TaxID=572307 RepID=F0VEP8_NEOCL|nr:3-ketodihydrosphingosine reductase TSC10, related [Neospora caninum Liverpool]CBZ52192.1 3-ketodihydrosphingosine reductase TSC10, related [Neospora caninum Liverpool]CEL66160.1 TPA: 3-ketodihydrosphingosine reductase TSC10, related [Neospora caninum Liverpool]|eukprot:XP_003882224.1 3-ketodihydrosphingosine reductase TSC10, related [Neospora caninum Liverpool]
MLRLVARSTVCTLLAVAAIFLLPFLAFGSTPRGFVSLIFSVPLFGLFLFVYCTQIAAVRFPLATNLSSARVPACLKRGACGVTEDGEKCARLSSSQSTGGEAQNSHSLLRLFSHYAVSRVFPPWKEDFAFPYRIEGRHALITGGSKGIGLSLALACVRKRAKVISLVARTLSALEEAQALCLTEAKANSLSVAIQIVQADLADTATVHETLENATNLEGHVVFSDGADELKRSLEREMKLSALSKKKTGHGTGFCPVDFLFCNAAAVEPRTLDATPSADVSRILDMNVKSTVLQIKAVLPCMQRRQFGCICFTNSLAALVPIYGFALYSATKAAFTALFTALEQETAGSNILFANAYLPSVDTPGFQREKEVRPAVTAKLEGGVSVRSADAVAKDVADQIERGRNCITVCEEGWLLSRRSATFCFASSFANLVFEVLGAGLIRLYLVWMRASFQFTAARERKPVVPESSK